ncbi:MAG: PKD domain-containing protein [Flavisolibacter sp.]
MRTKLTGRLRLSIFLLCLGSTPMLSTAQSSGCNTAAAKTYVLHAIQNEIYLPYTSNGILSSVRGGDTLKIPAGTYNDIILDSFSGDPCRPVIIINMGGKVASGYIRIDHKAQYFKITGTGDTTIKYGFKVGTAGAGAGLAIGIANHYEVEHLECSNSDVGFLCKKNPYAGYPSSVYPNYIINKVSIHDNYIHNTHGEGMYIGHTYPLADPYNNNLVPIQMDSVEIFNNLVDSTDWDGIQLSNARNGASIHDNVVKHFGLINMGAQQAGIIMGANTNGNVYNNMILGGTGNGMEIFGYGHIQIYNNLITDAGQDGTQYKQDALFIDDVPMYSNPGLYIEVINNTIVNSGRDAVRMYNDRGSVVNKNVFKNNLLVQPNSLTTGGSFSQYLNYPGTLGTESNNIKLPLTTQAKFIAPGLSDYHLLAGSPAIDTGADVSSYGIVTDLDHFNRPYGTKYDAGAYEFTNAPPPPNRAPIVNAGANQTINLPNSTATVKGTATDLDGTIASTLWSQLSGPNTSTITSPSKLQTTITGLIQGVYKFQLKATDNVGASSTSTMQVTVSAAANIPPSANAGANQVINLPVNSITLTGSGSDADGNITDYLWSYVSGPSQYSITSNSSAQTTVTNLVAGTYVFQLKVTDNNGATATANVQVTVNPASPHINIPPAANAGANQTITLPTNSTVLNGSGTDQDGTIASYQWTFVSGPATCTLNNPNTAQTNVSGLLQGVYKFQLTVTDDKGATNTSDMQVTVNAAPPVSGLAFNVYPNPVITTVNITFDAPLNGQKTKIIIVDAMGRIVYLEEFTRTNDRMIKQINLSNLMTGGYVVSIDTGFDMLTTKLFKN